MIMTVLVLGRFPPPIDGQTIATERLASLLESEVPVKRINTEQPHSPERGAISSRMHRAGHFMRLRPRLRAELAESSGATVLWPAVSPDFFGHLRDLLTTVPALRPDQKVYAVVHRGNFRQVFESPFTSATAKRLVQRLRSVVFLTDHLSEQCAKWIPEEKRVVIPNTLDDDLIFSDSEVEDKRALRTTRERLCLLFVGHMIPSKGYLDVLEAFRIAHQNGVDFDGHFVGRWNADDDRENFNARVRDHGLEEVIHHHGPLSDRGAIKSLYRDADVLLLPTYYRNEAQPLVILEALSSATPVVSTRHAGIPEMIRHEKEGLLVAERDPDALARAVLRLSSIDYWTEISIQARQRFLSKFAPDQVRRKWMMLVEE